MPLNVLPLTPVISRRLRTFSGMDAADVDDIRWEQHRASRKQMITDLWTFVGAGVTAEQLMVWLQAQHREIP